MFQILDDSISFYCQCFTFVTLLFIRECKNNNKRQSFLTFILSLSVFSNIVEHVSDLASS